MAGRWLTVEERAAHAKQRLPWRTGGGKNETMEGGIIIIFVEGLTPWTVENEPEGTGLFSMEHAMTPALRRVTRMSLTSPLPP